MMKIIDERKTNTCHFCEVRIGECFLYKDVIYMRTNCVLTDDAITGRYNSVNLENGNLCTFGLNSDTELVKVDANIIIK